MRKRLTENKRTANYETERFSSLFVDAGPSMIREISWNMHQESGSVGISQEPVLNHYWGRC